MATRKVAMPKSKAKTAYGLLSDVCKVITDEPKRYDQRHWIGRVDDIGADFKPAEYPACGTVGCVAGWVVALTTKQRRIDYDSVEYRAASVLGLNGDQAFALFDGLAVPVRVPSQTPEHARAGVKHIRKFQKKYARLLKAKKVTTAK